MLRRPVAAAFLDDGRTLCVANQRSGTVSLVDVRQGHAVGEVAVGKHLTDLAVLPDRKHVLVVDDERHELVALSFDGARLSVRARLAVAPYPASITVQADGKRATVASLWSRRVQVVDLTPLSSSGGLTAPRVLHTIRLPFAPAQPVRAAEQLAGRRRRCVRRPTGASWMRPLAGCWRFTN